MPTPLYRQIASDLRALINRGLQPGEQIPSRNQLVAQYECTPKTVERAVEVLIGERLVEAKQGSGVFVRRPQPLVVRHVNERGTPDPVLGTRFFTAEANRQGYVGDQRVLDVARIVPPAEIAERLHAGEDEIVLLRSHLLMVGDTPISIADAHYRLGLAAGTPLEDTARIERGAVELLSDLGFTPGKSRYELRMREPTRDEHELLQLREGEWIADMLVTLFAAGNGTPLRVTAWRMSGDRNALVFDV